MTAFAATGGGSDEAGYGRTILADPALDANLRERGYVVLEMMQPDEIAQLREIADRLYVDERHGFHASNLSREHDYRHAVNREVSPVLAAAARAHLVDYEPFFSSLVIKWPGEDSAFPSHQDWTMVDEGRFRSINFFCPLADTTVENGALRVLPGSHRVLTSQRVSPSVPVGCESPGWRVTPDDMETIELQVGQVLVFDHALLHCSSANTTDDARWAVITAFKPTGSELFHWYVPDPAERTLEVYRVDSDFFADFDIGNRPSGEPIRTEEFTWDGLEPADVLRRCGVTPTEPLGRAGLMFDEQAERHLDRLGWVVIDLFEPTEVDALRSAYRSLPHDVVRDRSFAEGFHATVVDERDEFRRASDLAIREIVEPAVDRHFDRLDVAFTNWVSKEPGAAAAPYHVDWTFVDEAVHRSVSFWSPLTTTDESNGCIGVVDASHTEVTFVRAARHPSYLETDRWGRSLPGSHTVPLEPGQAVVFDHRTVHFSTPNHTDERRIAVTCELVPEEAELLHFEQVGPGRFLRHHVTADFFTTYTAERDPMACPGRLSTTEAPGVSFHHEMAIATDPAVQFDDTSPDEPAVMPAPQPEPPHPAADAPTRQRSTAQQLTRRLVRRTLRLRRPAIRGARRVSRRARALARRLGAP